ncbi:MAG: A24 family peptidase C-terminal domain-containing protein [Nitrososphaera sp.]
MLESVSQLYYIRIILALVMLLTASFLDIRKREINDMLWIGFGAISVVLIFFDTDVWHIIFTLAFAMIIAPVALLLWRLGIFGGADALCLIVLAALAPMQTLNNTQITPFTSLTNAAIFSIAPIFVNIVRNMIAVLRKEDLFKGVEASKLNRAMAFCIGYKAKNIPKYSFSIERMTDGIRKLDFSLKHAENETFCTAENTWVTPGIPYIIYITAGFITQIFYGDLILNMIQR